MLNEFLIRIRTLLCVYNVLAMIFFGAGIPAGLLHGMHVSLDNMLLAAAVFSIPTLVIQYLLGAFIKEKPVFLDPLEAKKSYFQNPRKEWPEA